MLISPTFFVSWSQRKWGKEISGSLRLAATTMPSRPSTEPLLPAAILAAEIGSLRRPDASRRPCVRLLPTRSSLRAFRAPLKGSKVSVHFSLPLSVPRRGNLLLSFQRDKRSKTASAFFVLGTQRNPNQRKVIHLIILAQCAATIRPRASLQTSLKPRCSYLQRGFLFDLSYICHTGRTDDAFEAVCTYIMNRSNLSFQRRQSGISVSSRVKKAAVWSGCSR